MIDVLIVNDNKYSAAILSYPKDINKIQNEIKSILIQEKVSIKNDALNLLSLSLGDDHLNSTKKIETILSFVYPKKTISSDDVEKCIIDSSLIEIDNLVFSVFNAATFVLISALDAVSRLICSD